MCPFVLFASACEEDPAQQNGGDPPDPPAACAGLDATIRPSKRSEHSGQADPATGRVAIFGGDRGRIVAQAPQPEYIDETWVFNPGAGWTEITGGSSPSARGRHTTAYDPNGNRMLMFGGRWRPDGQSSGDYTVYNDLWAFDFDDDTWTLLDDGTGTGPQGRWFPASVYDERDDTFYIFGGGINTNPLNFVFVMDVWAYKDGAWSAVTTLGQPPSPRLWSAYAYDSFRHELVVFGGQPGNFVSGSFNDTHVLSLSTNQWSKVHPGGLSAPSARFSAMMTYDSTRDQILLTGGHVDGGVDNDLWAFKDGLWTELHMGDVFTGVGVGCGGNPAEIPANYVVEDLNTPERRSNGVFLAINGVLFVSGGETDCSDHLDDTWCYSDNGEQAFWYEAMSSRTGESCARRQADCDCLCI